MYIWVRRQSQISMNLSCLLEPKDARATAPTPTPHTHGGPRPHPRAIDNALPLLSGSAAAPQSLLDRGSLRTYPQPSRIRLPRPFSHFPHLAALPTRQDPKHPGQPGWRQREDPWGAFAFSFASGSPGPPPWPPLTTTWVRRQHQYQFAFLPVLSRRTHGPRPQRPRTTPTEAHALTHAK